MELLLSAVVSDLVSRAMSMVIQRYLQPKGAAEEKLQRLRAVLLRIDTVVEEAKERHISNKAMLQQLQMLRQAMYRGHYILDAVRYRDHRDKVGGKVGTGHSLAFSRLKPSSRPFFACNTPDKDMDLEKIQGHLERMINDMQEFVIFLVSCPRIVREPYNAYLFLDQVMFGCQMEKETIISFLLQSESSSDGNLDVLPIIGAARVGKSTLVEHVCLDNRVRDRFSSIVFFSGKDLNDGNLATLRGSGVIKHQNRTPTSNGGSLVVIDLAGDMDDETWRSLYSSGANHMAPGSKVLLTSRSEKIASFGTIRALRLKFLPEEAYWYFFKTIAFGGTNPEEQPDLASLGMEIAVQLNRSFMAANTIASLLRANLDIQFWRRVLRCLRDSTRKHLSLFGKHPINLLQIGRPVHIWTLTKTSNVIVMRNIQQECSPHNDVPRITTEDVLSGSVTPSQGRIQAVAWKSRIPPCYTYLVNFDVSYADKHTTLGKKRSRQERI